MTQAEYELLTRIEQGTSTFRPAEPGPGIDGAFTRRFELLLALRQQGWIRLPDGRITRDRTGRVMLAGPRDLTDAGREALERDRSLGPRPRTSHVPTWAGSDMRIARRHPRRCGRRRMRDTSGWTWAAGSGTCGRRSWKSGGVAVAPAYSD
jgi:hypothetical protein